MIRNDEEGELKYSTEEAIEKSIEAFRANIAFNLVRSALIRNGFSPKKAGIISRWAKLAVTRKPT